MDDLRQYQFTDDLRSADLSSWMGQRDLVSLTLDVMQTMEWPQAEFNAALHGNRILPRRMMVTLLTYCYATGMYSSHEIELAIARNETIRYLCARIYPSWNELRRFRRQNKELIHEALTKVLKAAWEFRLWLTASHCPDGSVLEILGSAATVSPLDIDFSKIAHDRIKAAIFLDSVMLED